MAEHHHGILDPDPLYDAPWMIFVYAAWVATTWLVSDVAGLAVLVAGTGVLAAFALRRPAPPNPQRSFAADFAAVLLFCAASIGVGVFVVDALASEPQLTLAVAFLSIATGIVATIAWRPQPAPAG